MWTTPIVLGRSITLQPVFDNEPPVADHYWTLHYQNLLVDTSFDYATLFFCDMPETFTIKLHIIFGEVPGLPPLPPETISKTITIPGCSGVVMKQGRNVPTQLGFFNELEQRFRLQCNDEDCGPYIAGIAQEQVPYALVYGNPEGSTTWEPDDDIPVRAFRLEGNEISDIKRLDNTPDNKWATYGIGATVVTATQYLRIKYHDPLGNTKYYNVGTIEEKYVKVSGNEWESEADVYPPFPND